MKGGQQNKKKSYQEGRPHRGLTAPLLIKKEEKKG